MWVRSPPALLSNLLGLGMIAGRTGEVAGLDRNPPPVQNTEDQVKRDGNRILGKKILRWEAVMLELKDFVQQTLVQIMEGVTGAQEELKDIGGRIVPSGIYTPSETGRLKRKSHTRGNEAVYMVDFDVAITSGESDTGKGKAGIFVAFLNARVEGEVEEYNSTISRIKFPVPIDYPTQS